MDRKVKYYDGWEILIQMTHKNRKALYAEAHIPTGDKKKLKLEKQRYKKLFYLTGPFYL